MREVYRTEFVLRKQPEALVIHCSDPGYQLHFQEFLHHHLGLEGYELIAVPGGPQCLTLADYLPKFSWVGWRWVKFLVGVARPRRAILIAHENCRWYADLRFPPWIDDLERREVNDLRRVRAELRERFGGLAVETYFARHDGPHVVFDAVPP